MEYETVIGLEIHAQLNTVSKMFCGCRSAFGDNPNTNACPVCLGLPGALPVLNRRAIEMAVLTGCAVGCTVENKSIFARKNYFYPDLPKGYQISQYEQPICTGGGITIPTETGDHKEIRLTRIHLEEDAGKLIHDQADDSLFDVNRCGTPLMEIVSEPDIRTPAEAFAFLTALKRILRYLDVCDCNMEQGSLRCDANISLRPHKQTALGTKTELKNMNSFHGVEKALQHEALRQRRVLEAGGVIEQQTFLWDAQRGKTMPMRSKEHAHDYRYFPEPDLHPLVVDRDDVDRIRRSLPELPDARRNRFVNDYGLVPDHAAVLSESREVADYYEKTARLCGDAPQAANWVQGEVLRMVKDTGKAPQTLHLTPGRCATIIELVRESVVSVRAAKQLADAVEKQDREPRELVDELGMTQISDTSELESVIDSLLGEYPTEKERLRNGESKLMSFFLGQIMKATRGKANPQEARRIVMEKIA